MITINNREIPIPETWNDFSLHQALRCYQIISQSAFNALEPEEQIISKRIEIMKVICNIDAKFLCEWNAQALEEDPENGHMVFLQDMMQLALTASAFAFEEKEPGKFQVALTYTATPWPYIERPAFSKAAKLKMPKLYGPARVLSNITIYEMGMAFMAFEKYIAEPTSDNACELIAILYRPEKPATAENRRSAYQGDRRLPLLHHEATIPQRVKQVRKLPPLVRGFILFWFASCRQLIIRSYPNIFTHNPHGEAGEPAGNDYAWGGVLLNLADGLPNLDAVAQQHYANALTYLSMLEDQRKKHEMEAARQKREARRAR